jgi:hypothetical protein
MFWVTLAGVIAVIAYTSVAAWQACLTKVQIQEAEVAINTAHQDAVNQVKAADDALIASNSASDIQAAQTNQALAQTNTIAANELRLAQQQLMTAESNNVLTHRPWVDFQIAPTSSLNFIPMQTLNVRITTTNIGSTPALNEWTDIEFYDASDSTFGNFANVSQRCADVRNRERSKHLGATLFPGASKPLDASLRVKTIGFTVMPVILACAFYQFTFSGKTHETERMYYVTKPAEAAFQVGFPTEGGPVPLSELRIVEMWESTSVVN